MFLLLFIFPFPISFYYKKLSHEIIEFGKKKTRLWQVFLQECTIAFAKSIG